MIRRWTTSWVPPSPEWIKINFDVAFDPNDPTFWAVGVVARNCDGALLFVYTDILPRDDSLPEDSITVGEALAAKAAIECGKSMNSKDKDFILLEGDSKEVIRAINSAMNNHRYYPDLVDDRIFDTVRFTAKSLDKCIGGGAQHVLPTANDWASRVARWAANTKNTGFVPPHLLGDMARRLKRDNLPY